MLDQLTGASMDCLIHGSPVASGISGTVSGYSIRYGSSPIRNVVVNGVRLGDLEVSALEQEYGIQIEGAPDRCYSSSFIRPNTSANETAR